MPETGDTYLYPKLAILKFLLDIASATYAFGTVWEASGEAKLHKAPIHSNFTHLHPAHSTSEDAQYKTLSLD